MLPASGKDRVATLMKGDWVGTTWVQSACGRCAYCRENRGVTGQTLMSCVAACITGFTAQGGQAEDIAVSSEDRVLLLDGPPYEDAAPVMCAGYPT